jgi:hypothetical protein
VVVTPSWGAFIPECDYPGRGPDGSTATVGTRAGPSRVPLLLAGNVDDAEHCFLVVDLLAQVPLTLHTKLTMAPPDGSRLPAWQLALA